ncbi:hypothetical protein ACOZB2_23660 [Pantoea endophytica]|uniref:Uncharacterized protein n=1 Tax=Pantoea sp. BJ2 TaxID=3141322 RepID=A0AAU7U378_9GAMM
MTRNNGIVWSGSLWLLILSQSAFSAGVNDNRDKLDDDPPNMGSASLLLPAAAVIWAPLPSAR